MTGREWLLLIGFVGMVYGVSVVSPEAATLLAGFVAVVAFVRGDVTRKVLGK